MTVQNPWDSRTLLYFTVMRAFPKVSTASPGKTGGKAEDLRDPDGGADMKTHSLPRAMLYMKLKPEASERGKGQRPGWSQKQQNCVP